MSVVADASPLIFLAKIRRLELVKRLLGKDIRVTRSVRDETLGHDADPEETRVLEGFFAGCSVEEMRHPRRFALALSCADNESLTLAVRCRAAVILCDDRLVRLVAETEGIRPLGTLGLLLCAMRRGLVPKAETRRLVDTLVRTHGFRISIEVYQSVIAQIESRSSGGKN